MVARVPQTRAMTPPEEVEVNWLRENWLWIAVVIFFFWMHAKMHGGHGAHGGQEGHGGHGGCGSHGWRANPNERAEAGARRKEHDHARH